MRTLEHLKQKAIHSYNFISQDPDGRGDRTITEYSTELDEDIAKITMQGANTEAITKYKSGYESKFTSWLSSQGNCASSFVCGPANFPVAKMEKRNRWAQNHYNAFRAWRDKVLNAYDRYQRKVKIAEAGGELAIAKKKLENIEGQKYRSATKKRYRERVADLEAKEIAKVEGNKEFEFTGGKVLLNVEIDRLQIMHEQKPAPEVIQQLKSNGFRWSPFYKAWQRQLTDNAKRATSRIIGKELVF